MKTNFTAAQLKWASEHDWFLSGNLFAIRAKHVWADLSGYIGHDVVEFTDFKALRDWAGY